jgi:hypothetical protein
MYFARDYTLILEMKGILLFVFECIFILRGLHHRHNNSIMPTMKTPQYKHFTLSQKQRGDKLPFENEFNLFFELYIVV